MVDSWINTIIITVRVRFSDAKRDASYVVTTLRVYFIIRPFRCIGSTASSNCVLRFPDNLKLSTFLSEVKRHSLVWLKRGIKKKV